MFGLFCNAGEYSFQLFISGTITLLPGLIVNSCLTRSRLTRSQQKYHLSRYLIHVHLQSSFPRLSEINTLSTGHDLGILFSWEGMLSHI